MVPEEVSQPMTRMVKEERDMQREKGVSKDLEASELHRRAMAKEKARGLGTPKDQGGPREVKDPTEKAGSLHQGMQRAIRFPWECIVQGLFPPGTKEGVFQGICDRCKVKGAQEGRMLDDSKVGE